MAVHLNAHLKTRFIPVLFVAVMLLSWVASSSHAEEQQAPQRRPAREELRSLMNESDEADSRAMEGVSTRGVSGEKGVNRRPGFSPIIYSPEPVGGGRAAIAAQYGRRVVESLEAAEAGKVEEPTREGVGSSDRISIQPGEPVSD